MPGDHTVITWVTVITVNNHLNPNPRDSPRTMSAGKKSRLEPYRQALRALSVRTGAPLPALVTSFVVLHEASAVVPLIGLFYVSRGLGIGERVVETITPSDKASELNLVQEKCRSWVQQGEAWSQRVGIRYGAFGYEKGMSLDAAKSHAGGAIAGDIANAVAAYAATKVSLSYPLFLGLIIFLNAWQALLPVRIAASLYLSPAFSRAIVMPVQKAMSNLFRRKT